MLGVNETTDFASYRGQRYTKEVPNSREPTRGPIFVTESIALPQDDKETMHHRFLASCAMENGSRPCYGTRTMVNGKPGPYEWMTYKEVWTRSEAIASGMTRFANLKRQDRIGIFSRNRVEWCLTAHAIDRQAFVVVPLYATLGPNAVPFIVNQTEMTLLLCSKENWKTVVECTASCPTLRYVIQFDIVTEDQKEEAESNGLELTSLQEIEAMGECQPLAAEPPLPDDMETICYTSGTSGNPKGVILTHRNMRNHSHQSECMDLMCEEDCHLSYLPLAHVFERLNQTAFVNIGGKCGFYSANQSCQEIIALQTRFPLVSLSTIIHLLRSN